MSINLTDEENPKLMSLNKAKNQNNKNYIFNKIKADFLSKLDDIDINDIHKLKIHVLLDYKDFINKKIDEKIIEKYESGLTPIYMFNLSLNNLEKKYEMYGSNPPQLLLPNNITFAELNQLILELNAKFVKGGSRITKRALPKNKKQKTEKKRD
jgi:hypothetical protein